MTTTASTGCTDSERESTEHVDRDCITAAGARRIVPPWTPHDGPVLVVVQGPCTGDHFDLYGPDIAVGRADNNDIVLTDPTVSRLHARIQMHGNDLTVADLGSVNGTYVNRRSISRATTTNHGDEIQVGATRMLLLTHRPHTRISDAP